MVRTPAQTLANARSRRSFRPYRCLQFVRTCAGIPPRHATALQAWKATKVRGTGPAPAGSFVWFSAATSGRTAGAGHVAISDGAGYCITTGVPTASGVARVSIDGLAKAWGRRVLGWSWDVNGVTLAGAGNPTSGDKAGGSTTNRKLGSRVLRRGMTGADVRELQRILNAWYPSKPGRRALVLDGSYGPATERRVRYLQQRARITVDGIAGPQTLDTLNVT